MKKAGLFFQNILRKKSVIALILLLSIACMGGAVHHASSGEQIPKLQLPKAGNLDTSSVQVTLEASAAEQLIGEELPVYRMKAVDADAERQKISRIFDVKPTEIGSFPDGNTLDGRVSVGLDEQTGRWFYREALDWDAAGKVTLSDEEAIEIAQNFITENDLYPVDDLGEAKIGETYTGTEVEGNKQTLQKNVYYYPTVAGEKVYGNFRICVSIGSNGNIVGVDKFANEYELVNRIDSKKQEAVEQALAEGDYTFEGETALQALGLDALSYAFYADPESEYIQPIYVLEDQEEKCSIWMDAAAT